MSVLTRLFVVVILFSATVGAKSPEESSCKKDFLARKDCILKLGRHEVQLTKEKIMLNDGVWRTVIELPLVGESTEWSQAQLKKIAQRFLIELQVWDAPQGEAQVQSLYWYVYEMVEGKAELRVKQILTKRRRGDKVLVDKLAKFGILPVSGSRLKWWVNKEQGMF